MVATFGKPVDEQKSVFSNIRFVMCYHMGLWMTTLRVVLCLYMYKGCAGWFLHCTFQSADEIVKNDH